jgi:hypothetical protein
MADPQTHFIRVQKFYQKVGKRAKIDPETGEKMTGPDGKFIFVQEVEDWCMYSPLHSPQNTAVPDRIRFLMPKADKDLTDDDAEGMKYQFQKARWAQIEPAYLAWKSGHELPINGTPLAAWAGVSDEQAEVFRQNAISSVEDIAALGEAAMGRIRLPNVRELVKLAQMFVANKDQSAAAEREAVRDEKIADLAASNAELAEKLEAAMALLADRRPVAAEGDEEVSQLRAALERQGIAYDKRFGADRLRELLNAQEAA